MTTTFRLLPVMLALASLANPATAQNAGNCVGGACTPSLFNPGLGPT